MPLIKQIHEAIEVGHLCQPFTTQDLKEWIRKNEIVKDDGEKYEDSSIDAILSNSDTKNNPTTNNNRKMLQSKINQEGKKEYWF